MFDSNQYILIGKNPVAIPREQFLEWGQWFEWHCRHGTRHVGSMHIEPRKPFRKGNPSMLRKINRQRSQKIFISTVFLGLNHNHWGGLPILFESMVFGGKHDDYQMRYYTWDEAKEAHEKLVKKVTKGMVL